MYKILLCIVLLAFVVVIQAQQIDEEASIPMFFRAKQAADRAAHAAAQQLDIDRLSDGQIVIDEEQARAAALRYLQLNLFLDADNEPKPNSMLNQKVDIVRFVTINANQSFPYTYRDEVYDYEVVLQRPGVVLMVHVKYPNMFQVFSPMEWFIKATGENTEF